MIVPSSFAAKWHFRWSIREMVYNQLRGQLENGIATQVALNGIASRQARRKRDKVVQILRYINADMRGGLQFSEAMAKWVPVEEVALIRSGEISRALPSSLKKLVEVQQAAQRIQTNLRASMVAPSLMFLMVFGFMIFMVEAVLPVFDQTLPRSEATGTTAALYWMGDFFVGLGFPLTLTTTISLIVYTLWLLPRWTGIKRVLVDQFVPFNLYREVVGWRWLVSYIALVGVGGMSEPEALRSQLVGATPYLAERLGAFELDMRAGSTLHAAMAKPRFGTSFGFEFPSLDIMDEIEAVQGFKDYSLRLEKVTETWFSEIEKKATQLGSRLGVIAQTLMYAVIVLIVLATNDMQIKLQEKLGQTERVAPSESTR